MPVKHIISPGIGFSPGSVKYIVTRGLTIGAAALTLERHRSAFASKLVRLPAGAVIRARTKSESGTPTIYTVADGSGLSIHGPLNE